MNSQFLLEKLKSSKEFKKFKKENPDAYLCSGFFIIDLENEEFNKYHFDFFLPKSKKTFSFELERGVKLVPLERIDEQIPSKISFFIFDFEEIEKIILAEMKSRKINNKIQKMIFSLQNVKGKNLLLGTIFIPFFGMIKTIIDVKRKKITDFEKKSFFDMFNIMRRE
jgi:hypothetical protein